ncbi:hypothetical protein VTK73DRAFT_5511 [Phialemonium thermophilum]|uniref:Uncharacterized protein n=1 Tax=Phialemonium thermophilum TaxID=223376 RepID=A0ABR3V1G2_9PEZI
MCMCESHASAGMRRNGDGGEGAAGSSRCWASPMTVHPDRRRRDGWESTISESRDPLQRTGAAGKASQRASERVGVGAFAARGHTTEAERRWSRNREARQKADDEGEGQHVRGQRRRDDAPMHERIG